MATLRVYVCDSSGTASEALTGLGGQEHGTCSAAAGHWQEVDTAELEFDLISWLQTPANQAEFAGFFGAGFVLVGVAHATGWGVRLVLSMLR